MKGMDCFLPGSVIAISFTYHSPDSHVSTNVEGTLNVKK